MDAINLVSDLCGVFNACFLYILLGFIFSQTFAQGITLSILFFILAWIMMLNSNNYPLHVDNKYDVMSYIPEEYKPKQRLLKDAHELKFPIILKPTVCTKAAKGIHFCGNGASLKEASQQISREGGTEEYMAQEYVDQGVEIGVLVEKWPWEDRVSVISIVEKHNKDVVRKDCQSSNCRDRKDLIPFITPAIQNISRMIPGFNSGRYDRRKHKAWKVYGP